MLNEMQKKYRQIISTETLITWKASIAQPIQAQTSSKLVEARPALRKTHDRSPFISTSVSRQFSGRSAI